MIDVLSRPNSAEKMSRERSYRNLHIIFFSLSRNFSASLGHERRAAGELYLNISVYCPSYVRDINISEAVISIS